MFEKQIEIPSAEEIVDKTPLSESLKKIKYESDGLVKKFIKGEREKIKLNVGT